MVTDLRPLISARAQRPLCVVKIDGTPITGNIVSADVTMGSEQQSATAAVRWAAEAYPEGWLPHTTLEVRLGYAGPGGGTVPVFIGEIEDVDTRFLPYSIDVRASGFLKRLQRQAGNTDPLAGTTDPIIRWTDATDTQIWRDLMRLGGVPSYDPGDGDGRTLAGPIDLLPGDELRATVDELDHASDQGQRTFEYAGWVYRAPALRVPAATPVWIYAEGAPPPTLLAVYGLGRQRSDRDLKNQVVITATPKAGTAPTAVVGAVRQQESDFWGVDGDQRPIYVPFTLGSRFVETRAQCDAVAQRYMYELNKITDLITLRTPLNPYARPAMTVGIRSARMGRATTTPYWVRQVAHHVGAEGATTDWTLEGGAGDLGYLVGLRPIAQFTLKATRETYLVAGVPTTIYTVAADGSTSYDPDGTPLTYAWSNNENGDTGAAVLYQTHVTAAQWADTTTPPAITLVVTDADTPTPHSASATIEVPSAVDGKVKMIAMYVAAHGAARATPDGWQTANNWTPGGGAHAISVGRIGAQGTNYFGLDDGHVYRTTDYLATAPTDVGWTAPAAVNALWMSELDANIVALGLANGAFYLTTDAFATAPVLKRTFGGPIRWINGSAQARSQWRACVGEDVWYTDDDFAAARVLVSLPGLAAAQDELTDFANYALADGAAGDAVLRKETGEAIAFPTVSPPPAAARATAFIDDDALLVGDDQGRAYLGAPASTVATLAAAADVGAGAVNDLLRDNTNPAAAYAACETALRKTFDRATSWVSVLLFDGTTTRGLRLGYDAAPLTPKAPVITDQLLERVFHRSRRPDWPAGQAPADTIGMDLWNPVNAPDGEGARNDAPPTNWYRTDYTPADHVVGGWTHTWQSGDEAADTFGVMTNLYQGESQDYDRCNDAWIRSESNHGGTGVPSGWPGQPGPGQHPQCVFRWAFTLPSLTLTKALLQVSLPPAGSSAVNVEELYVNNTAVGASPSTGYLDPALLVADGTTVNVVAFRLKQTGAGGPRPAAALKLAFGALADSVSLFQDVATSKLVWGSSGEGSCASYASAPAGWYEPITGTIVPGDAHSLANIGDRFVGIYAAPWPASTGSDSGKKLANQNGSRTADAVFVHKQALDMPAGADTAWWLYVRKGEAAIVLDDVYLNGTRLSTPTPASPASDPGGWDAAHLLFRFDVPSGAVAMGARNTLALRCHGASSSTGYSRLGWYMVQQ